MKTTFNLILALIIICFTISCKQIKKSYASGDFDECDYENCNTNEPFQAELEIKFSAEYSPKVIVYQGSFQNRYFVDSIKVDTAKTNILHYTVPINNTYTIIARYLIDSDTVFAIDNHYVYKSQWQECDSTCWKINNIQFNIKLKNLHK